MRKTQQDRQTLKAARIVLQHVEITETEYDEYRVNVVGGREATAYYTSDVDDAVATAKLIDAEVLKGGR